MPTCIILLFFAKCQPSHSNMLYLNLSVFEIMLFFLTVFNHSIYTLWVYWNFMFLSEQHEIFCLLLMWLAKGTSANRCAKEMANLSIGQSTRNWINVNDLHIYEAIRIVRFDQQYFIFHMDWFCDLCGKLFWNSEIVLQKNKISTFYTYLLYI